MAFPVPYKAGPLERRGGASFGIESDSGFFGKKIKRGNTTMTVLVKVFDYKTLKLAVISKVAASSA